MKIGKITEELKQQILELNDLREVAQEYGVIFNSSNKARCPFHKDGKNGNLHLHEKKGEHSTYHCYSETCRAGTMWEDSDKTKRHMLKLPDGTVIEDGGPSVIGFVMNMERCSYVDACIILMNRAGIEIPEGKVNYKEERYKKKITALNIQYCKNLLNTPKVLSYLKKRGITKESIKEWRLGYIPEGDTSAPLGEKVSGRLVFGLLEDTYSEKGAKTVAFGYRTLKDENPKYYNDYTIEGIYEKKHYLYGITKARKEIRKAGYAIVTEGYMDTIIAHQTGLKNTVATCGTSFTREQMEKLRRLTKNLVFWYDGDGPGFESMLEQIPDLLEMGFRVKVVVAPGKDPAEWMNEMNQNREETLKFISKYAKPALQVIADEVMNHFEKEVKKIRIQMETMINEKMVEALDELLPILDTITDPAEKVVFRSMIEKRLKVNI